MKCDCGKDCEPGRDSCFRCRVSGIGFSFRGSAMHTRTGWNKTANDWRLENFGTTSEKELAARGIERVK